MVTAIDVEVRSTGTPVSKHPDGLRVGLVTLVTARKTMKECQLVESATY